MAVTMQAQRFDLTGQLEAGFDFIQQQVAHGFEIPFQRRRYPADLQQVGHRFDAQQVDSQHGSVSERLRGAHRVHAPQRSPDLLEGFPVARFRGMATLHRKQGEAQFAVEMQAGAAHRKWRYNGQVGGAQFGSESVLFPD